MTSTEPSARAPLVPCFARTFHRAIRIALTACLLIGTGVLQAQTVSETVLIRPSCAECKVEFRQVGQIGAHGDDDPVNDAKGFADIVAVRGSMLIALPGQLPFVWGLSLDGKLLWAAGRKGEGPGEFLQPDQLSVISPDTVIVYDRRTARTTPISRTGQLGQGSRALPGVTALVAYSPVSGVAMGRFGAKSGASRLSGLPLHLYHDQSIKRSFGEPVRVVDPRMFSPFDGLLLRVGDDVVTLPRAGKLVIQRWDTLGRLVKRLAYEPDWFPASEKFVIGTPDSPPSPMVYDAWVDARNRLWILAVRAGERWKDAFSGETKRVEGGQLASVISRPELYYQGMAVIIDLDRGTLVKAQPMPFVGSYAMGNGLIGVKRETRSGLPYLELFHARLVGP